MKLYKKADQTMRPLHGFSENGQDSLAADCSAPMATFPKVLMGFCSELPIEPINVSAKFELFLKIVVSPIPEVIGGTRKKLGSP